MPWDPLSAWPNERRWIWLTIAGWLLLLRGPAFVESLQAKSPQELVPDFFQEYASARSAFEELPIYGDLHESVQRYLGFHLNDRRWHVVVNAHPPTSILLALPFAELDFGRAFLTWNLVALAALIASLWIVQRQLRIPFSIGSLSPLLALLLLCFPLSEQCRLGQLTLILLLLISGTWAAERSGWPRLAGLLLGTATCIKLFPGFLFLYYALHGRRRVVIAGLATIAGLTALTAVILGIDAYRTYFFTVLPQIQWFRVGWNNNSLWGFWSRLFDPAPEHLRDQSLTEPLFYSPMLAKALSLGSLAVIVGILARAVRFRPSHGAGKGCPGPTEVGVPASAGPPIPSRFRLKAGLRQEHAESQVGVPASAGPSRPTGSSQESAGEPRSTESWAVSGDSRPTESGLPPHPAFGRSLPEGRGEDDSASLGQRHDLTFALAVTAMLLVSPICWEHYLLLLLAPLAIVWMNLPASRFARTLFLTIVVAFWLGYPVTWTAFGLNGRTATPIDSLGILSYQFYALLGFFALALMILRRGGGPSLSPSTAARQTLALGSVVMVALWAHVLHEMGQRYGLFHFIGGDFGIYRSIAAATLAEGPRAMNDPDLVAPFARALTRYYGPDAHNLNLGPGPYPAVYILPFLALTACSPIIGYAIWTVASLALAYAAVRGMAAQFREGGWGLILSCVLFFPIVMALVYGQLTMLFFYGFYRAYRSLEEGRDFRAGLWSGALYLKPQYVVFLILVFLLARRWRRLGGLLLAGLLVLLGSLAIVGPEGIRAQFETLRACRASAMSIRSSPRNG